MGHRLIHDFMVVITAHGLFERHPGLRIASIENGVAWVSGALDTMRSLSGSVGRDLVAQFHEHVWVTPFTHDDVPALTELVPVERILFGSDYPHAEGFAEPRQFMTLLEGLPAETQRRIMRDNARELMRG